MLQQPTSGPEGSKLAYRQPGLWISGKLTLNFAQKLARTRKNSHGVHKSVLHLKNRKKVPYDLSDVKSILWRQIYLDILQDEELIQPHSVSGHQQINTTGWAAINIGTGLQSQKVLKSFPGLAHHRRRRNNMLLWITSCFEDINLIWVSAWSYPNRTPYIIQPKGHDTRS